MESVEEHTKAWIMREEVELVTLPECVKSVRSLILRRMHKLIYCVNTQPKSAFHDKMQTSVCLLFITYSDVPADTSFNTIIAINEE